MIRRISVSVFFLLFFGAMVFTDDVNLPKNGSAVYVKYQSVYFYVNDSDLLKKNGDVKNKKVFYFGNKVTVIGNTKRKDSFFLYVQLPDKTKYWAPLDYLTTRFIVITGNDVATYSQPDESYATKVKLQPGVLGYFAKEDGGFVNVDFNCYMPVNNKGVWLGNLWIKNEGFTDDLKTAEQASYLIMAYYLLYGKGTDSKGAMSELKAGLSATEETAITPVLKDLISKLGGAAPASVETIVGNYYTTTIDDYKLRETPDANGNVIRAIVKGEKLKLLEKGDEATVDGIKGTWVKLETEKGETGWCLDSYLAEAKDQ